MTLSEKPLLALIALTLLTCLSTNSRGSSALAAHPVPLTRQLSGGSQGKADTDVSLRLVGAPLGDFFRIMSEVSGLNMVIDPDVAGTITLHVDGVPWQELFETVLSSYQLARIPSGHLQRIATLKTVHAEQARGRAQRQKQAAEGPLRTVSYRLNYAAAKGVVEDLSQMKGLMSERSTLLANERTNTLLISESENRMAELKGFLQQIDIPEPQVEIEARIVEVTTGFAREIGVAFGVGAGGANSPFRGGARFDTLGAAQTLTGAFSAGRLMDTFRLDAILSAGERRGKARVLSRPRISAQSQVEAVITQGSRIPIPAQGNFSASVRFETAALRLTVQPRITRQKTVILKLKLENNFPDFTRTVNGIPTILTSEAETQVLVPDGGTTAIGGILLEVDRNAAEQVPGLGRIPVIGHAFRRNAREKETREILFFLTSRITRH